MLKGWKIFKKKWIWTILCVWNSITTTKTTIKLWTIEQNYDAYANVNICKINLHITRQSFGTRWPFGPWRYGSNHTGSTTVPTRLQCVIIRLSSSVRRSIRCFAGDSLGHIAGYDTAVVVRIHVEVWLIGTQVLLEQFFGNANGHVAGDEWMGEKALGGRSLFGILGECCFDERMECGRPFVFFLERWRFEAAFGHEEEGSHRMEVEHGRLKFGEFWKKNTII